MSTKVSGRISTFPTVNTRTAQTPQSLRGTEQQLLSTLRQLTSSPTDGGRTRVDVARTSFEPSTTRSTASVPPLLPDSKPSDSAISKGVDEAFQHVYGGTQIPSSADRNEMRRYGDELRGQGKNATEIKYAVIEKLKAKRDGLGKPPDDATLNGLATDVFKSVFGRAPTGAEFEKWKGVAKDLAGKGMDATSIKYNLPSQMREVRDGLDKTSPAVLEGLAKGVFQEVFGRAPSGSELAKWKGVAQEMVDKDKMNASSVKLNLPSQMREVRDGLDKTSPAVLEGLAKGVFQEVFGRAPSGSEL
ncbi:hypothetical protein KRR26_34985, partial [Corallococcus sp. M34]|uniref:hypothetical protein n=1 Tax=Citreicoccus inhibens TaxID=2849499 RepID=UPI001C21D4A1